MVADLAIANGMIVTPAGRQRGSIAITEGKISSIETDVPNAKKTIDASDLAVFPGFIDGHVHFRDPAFPEKEDFTSGTRACAKGGITTVLEMPMADIGTSTGERFRDRREHLRPKPVVDWGMWGGGGQDALGHIADMAAEGAVGYKTFAREIYAARETNFAGTWATDDGRLLRVAHEIAQTGLIWSVHAENYAIVKALAEEVGEDGLRNGEDGFISIRPTMIEEEAISSLLHLAQQSKARLHIAHITTRHGTQLVKDASARGLPVTAEACIPHLVFTEEDIKRLGPLGHFTPRLRPVSDRSALWAGLKGGWIPMAASDHASYTRQDVEDGWGGQVAAPRHLSTAGSADTEYLAPLILTRAEEEGLTLEDVARVLSEGPAKLTGLWPNKGSLALGTDGDLTLVDLAATTTINAAEMESKAKLSAFEGLPMRGIPRYTIVRGTVVMEDGVVIGEPGFGQFQRPDRSAA